MDWFLYDNTLRHEKVKNTHLVNPELLRNSAITFIIYKNRQIIGFSLRKMKTQFNTIINRYYWWTDKTSDTW